MTGDIVKKDNGAVVVADENQMISAIMQAASNPDFDADKLEKLILMKERMESNEARKSFTAALVAFQENPPKLIKDKSTSFGTGKTSYSYAELAQVCTETASELRKFGIKHTWKTDKKDGSIYVTCVLSHVDGHSEETTLDAMPDNSGSKNSVQAIGSTVTYLQRYTLLSAVGIAVHGMDDDAMTARQKDKIDPEQIVELKNMIDDTKTDIAKFCKAFGVSSLPDLKQNQYGPAKSVLNQKKSSA